MNIGDVIRDLPDAPEAMKEEIVSRLLSLGASDIDVANAVIVAAANLMGYYAALNGSPLAGMMEAQLAIAQEAADLAREIDTQGRLQ